MLHATHDLMDSNHINCRCYKNWDCSNKMIKTHKSWIYPCVGPSVNPRNLRGFNSSSSSSSSASMSLRGSSLCSSSKNRYSNDITKWSLLKKEGINHSAEKMGPCGNQQVSRDVSKTIFARSRPILGPRDTKKWSQCAPRPRPWPPRSDIEVHGGDQDQTRPPRSGLDVPLNQEHDHLEVVS